MGFPVYLALVDEVAYFSATVGTPLFTAWAVRPGAPKVRHEERKRSCNNRADGRLMAAA